MMKNDSQIIITLQFMVSINMESIETDKSTYIG